MAKVALAELSALAVRALERAGASAAAARSTAAGLVAADAQGLGSHGVSRLPQYAGHLKSGRVDGQAVPKIVREKGACVLVDAADGLAFPACALAIREAVARARTHGVAVAGVTNSYHSGAAAFHLEGAAQAGLVGFAFTNSPSAMPAAGGKHGIFGTNPIAVVFPRRNATPLVIDLSLSEVARGKIMVAARDGKPIPEGWALDKAGNPTTDSKAALDGMMLPMGGVKGAMLALVVELLCCALTGAHMGFEADSFFTETGNRARIGQTFFVIDPGALAGNDVFAERIETLVAEMLKDAGVRLPGERRAKLAAAAARDGVEIPDALLKQVRTLAGEAQT